MQVKGLLSLKGLLLNKRINKQSQILFFDREVDMSDLPSKYVEDIETSRQILNLPDPKDTMPRSFTTIWALDNEEGQQELKPRVPSAMLPLNPFLKDASEKFGLSGR